MVFEMQKFVLYAVAVLCCVSRAASFRCIPNDEFQCRNEKQCIPAAYTCDGIPDCDDASDESRTECRCNDDHHVCDRESREKCFHGMMVCDGQTSCSDGSDEKNCGYVSTCKVNEFRCLDGQKCIPMRLRCSGLYNKMCQDKSDQSDCADRGCSEGQLKCDSGSCVRKELFCDGRENCDDGSDEKGCGYEDSDILFLNEGPNIYIKKRTKAGLEFTHSLHMSPRMNRTGVHNSMKITGLAFDAGHQNLFFSDASEPAIFAVDVVSLKWRYLVKDGISSPMDVAFDWSSKNVYWLDSGKAEVVSVDTLRRATILADLSNPVSLALSPNTGSMFIAMTGFESSVIMCGMDGKNKKILDMIQGTPASLALHPTESILYWTDPGEGTISYVNYSSSSVPKILRKKIDGLMSVTVTEREYYFTSGLTAGRGKNPGCEKDEGWKSIAYGVKPSGKMECLIGNGGCDYLCLTSEVGRSCACPSEKTLGEDGKSCLD